MPEDTRPSQRALALREGAPSQAQISKMLAGEKTITVTELYALCRALGVRASTLVAAAERAVAAAETETVVPIRRPRKVSAPVKRAARKGTRDQSDS